MPRAQIFGELRREIGAEIYGAGKKTNDRKIFDAKPKYGTRQNVRAMRIFVIGLRNIDSKSVNRRFTMKKYESLDMNGLQFYNTKKYILATGAVFSAARCRFGGKRK